mmetsp:Transcript_32823/g.57322  ORF Transcript_32823/g.57322 Transcript_32823/m.57322 type:complete len:260 (+) Transcript_32823:2381-3160(+)
MVLTSARAICDICITLYEDPLMLKAVELEDGAIITGDFGLIVKHIKSSQRVVTWLTKVKFIQKIKQLFKGAWGHRRFCVVLLTFLLAEVAREEMDVEFIRAELKQAYNHISTLLETEAFTLPYISEAAMLERIVPGFNANYSRDSLKLLHPDCNFVAIKGVQTPCVEALDGLLLHVTSEVIHSLHFLKARPELAPDNITKLVFIGNVLLVTFPLECEAFEGLCPMNELIVFSTVPQQLEASCCACVQPVKRSYLNVGAM